MNDSLAISLSGVGKRYVKLDEQAMLLRSLLPFRKPSRSELWALDDVSLDIPRGSTIGIIGRNGAGKTTLLRMLAGVTQPTNGTVRLAGRVAPLISVGVGFQKEMSGRENVYLNGMLLGMTKKQVDERFDEIVRFAEIEAFIDTPVKFYSSGMFVRLGFSVAIHSDPAILVIDEVLAVGDAAFQLKCIDRMREIQDRGATIVIVSHSMHHVRLLCKRVALLRRGRLEFDGDVETAIAKHYELLTSEADEHAASIPGKDSDGPKVSIEERKLSGAEGPTHQFEQGDIVIVTAKLRFAAEVADPQILLWVFSSAGAHVYTMATLPEHSWRTFSAGEVVDVQAKFVARLGGGTYRVQLVARDRTGRDHLAIDPGALFYVTPKLGSIGVADLGATIEVGGRHLTDHAPLTIDARPDEGPTHV